MITVLGRRNSGNVQKVMWALGELGVDYQREDVGGQRVIRVERDLEALGNLKPEVGLLCLRRRGSGHFDGRQVDAGEDGEQSEAT